MDSLAPNLLGRTVLIVEDERMLSDILRQVFVEAGFKVLVAETGEHALTTLEGREDIHLLVTDIRLPGHLSGWDVAERARERYPALPIVYTTAYSHEVSLPVSGGVLMTKPYRPSALKKVVEDLGLFRRPVPQGTGAGVNVSDTVSEATRAGARDIGATSMSKFFANLQNFELYAATTGAARLLLIKAFANEDDARRYARRHYPGQNTWVCPHRPI
jgi:CheY-like chemotaxis protein